MRVRSLSIVITVSAAVFVGAQPQATADLVLLNGKVFTADPQRPWAEGIAIRGDRIVEVGATAAMRRYADRARVIDVGGRVIVPGLNDAHTHVGARPPGVAIQVAGDDPTLDEVLAAVRKTAAETAAPQWMFGTIGERVLSDARATRVVLDQAAPGRIVKLAAWTGHGNLLSTAAMRVLGIGDRDADPPFGRYGRLADGQVSGLLEEYADVRANRRMTELAGRDAATASLRRLAEEAIGYGITTIQAMGNSLTAAELSTILPAANTPIRWRIIRFPIALSERDAPGDLAPLPKQPSPLVTVSGVKWILDGTPIERLAAMNEPYADRAGWSGRLNLSPADIETALRRALGTGDQPMFHIAGDRGIDTLLATMERMAPADRWQALRVRIEHGEFLSGARIARARRLGVVLVQNPSHFTFGPEMRVRYGPDRAAGADNVRSAVAGDVPFAIGADGPLNPFLNMMFAVTHESHPAEALTREQVIAAYTTGSAYAEFAEREKGRLAAGMLADVAVLTQDIFTVDARQLPATAAAMTIVGGRIVRDTMTSTAPAADQHDHAGDPVEKLGSVHFDTSCAATAQAPFDRAVALLHSFDFGRAIDGFNAALAADPSCVMAYWGIALSRWSNPFAAGVKSAAQVQLGLDAIVKAETIASGTTREREYIDAASKLYAGAEQIPQPARLRAYSDAMTRVAAHYPQDDEAQIFHALALAFSADPGDKTYARQLEGGAVLDRLFARHPDHPGLAHYIIHTYDVPPLADRALEAARRYAAIAPSAPHALHMPSHTFTRVGYWQESIDANVASAISAKRLGATAEELHASDYQTYAYLQIGQDAAARRILDALADMAGRFDPNAAGAAAPPSAGFFALAAIPARYALERGAWAQAAALDVRPSPFPYADAMTWFARAIGAGRLHRAAPVREAIDALARIRDRLTAGGEGYWAEQVEIERRGASAWLAFAEARTADALADMRAAAALEDATEKSAVTPGPLAPARELLGEMLRATGQPALALKEFEATLRKEPNRFRALAGAAASAADAGNRALAATYYDALLKMCADADRPGRAELAAARRFVTRRAGR